jgi:hypothetical protein
MEETAAGMRPGYIRSEPDSVFCKATILLRNIPKIPVWFQVGYHRNIKIKELKSNAPVPNSIHPA